MELIEVVDPRFYTAYLSGQIRQEMLSGSFLFASSGKSRDRSRLRGSMSHDSQIYIISSLEENCRFVTTITTVLTVTGAPQSYQCMR